MLSFTSSGFFGSASSVVDIDTVISRTGGSAALEAAADDWEAPEDDFVDFVGEVRSAWPAAVQTAKDRTSSYCFSDVPSHA